MHFEQTHSWKLADNSSSTKSINKKLQGAPALSQISKEKATIASSKEQVDEEDKTNPLSNKNSDSDNESFPLLTLVEKNDQRDYEPNFYVDATISSDSCDDSRKTVNQLSDNGETEFVVDVCSSSEHD